MPYGPKLIFSNKNYLYPWFHDETLLLFNTDFPNSIQRKKRMIQQKYFIRSSKVQIFKLFATLFLFKSVFFVIGIRKDESQLVD